MPETPEPPEPLETVVVVFHTDNHHTYTSRAVIATAKNVDEAVAKIGLWNASHGRTALTKEDRELLHRIGQTQNCADEGEFQLEMFPLQTTQSEGLALITAERLRQVVEEGWSHDHDDTHVNGEMRDAAICYAQVCDDDGAGQMSGSAWPWDASWWKPNEDPITNLVKAGALIAAEIDRLKRKKANASK